MGLFSIFSKKPKKSAPHAFVFICRGPDPSGLSSIISHMAMTDRGLYEAMKHFGYTGSQENLVMFGPDWNSTTYSSWRVQGEGEADDLSEKIEKAVREAGYSYEGENIKTARYDPSTSYAQMGLFMAYYFTE